MNKPFFKRLCLVATALAVLAAASYSQEKKASDSAHKIVRSGDLKWTPIIKGCEIAVVDGNPDTEGQPFVVRFHCADGAKTPPHWHPTDENITTLKGAFLVGMGDKFDESKLKAMNPGNFMVMPKEMRHFGMAKGDLVLQIHGIGPFKVNWVNPSEVQPPDAPAAAAPKP
jgi:quercetin dioxygenase-like cupin family protein